MTVQQMFNSFPVLQKLMELKLPIKKAYTIYNLIKQIDEQRKFFIQEEQKLINKFNAEVLPNGNIQFDSGESQAQFSQEHFNLMEYEIEDLKIVELTFEDLAEAEFTPRELMLLEGVVNIIE